MISMRNKHHEDQIVFIAKTCIYSYVLTKSGVDSVTFVKAKISSFASMIIDHSGEGTFFHTVPIGLAIPKAQISRNRSYSQVNQDGDQ